jgi:hypothetical protein
MGMLSAAINLELAEELAAQGIVGQHAFDGLFNDALGETGLKMGVGGVSARVLTTPSGWQHRGR